MNPRGFVLSLVVFVASASPGAAADTGDGPRTNRAASVPLPYAQTGAIASPTPNHAILGFCVPTGGGLVAITGPGERYGAATQRPAEPEKASHRVVWFSAMGEEIRGMDLDFAATVVGAAPDGGVYVAGDGVVTHLSSTGRSRARVMTPQGPKTAADRAVFEKSVADKHAAQLEAVEKQCVRLREVVAELEKKVQETDAAGAETADEDDPEAVRARQRQQARVRLAKSQVSRTELQLRQLEATADRLRRQDLQVVVEQALRSARQVRAITAAPDAVFVVTAEPSGYGFAVWRFDGRLEHPEKIVSQLTGCCSQMDVQVFGDQLAISANRKHCVELATFSGETVAKIGSRAGGNVDDEGFGGCCNPMNTCTAPDGTLLTSESSGVVKRFDADGTFREIVARADVRPGCKNSAIAIEPDGTRLYYLDVARGSVIVLTEADGQRAAKRGS